MSGELQGLILPAVLPQAVLGWFLLREAPLLVIFPGQRGISTFHKATLSLGNEAVLSSRVGVPCCCGAEGGLSVLGVLSPAQSGSDIQDGLCVLGVPSPAQPSPGLTCRVGSG